MSWPSSKVCPFHPLIIATITVVSTSVFLYIFICLFFAHFVYTEELTEEIQGQIKVEAGTTESRGESSIISLGLHQQPWTRYNEKGKKKKRRREGIDMA